MTIDRSPHDRLYWISGFAILGAGLTLRLFAAHGDLWRDEVSTLLLLKNVHQPWEIFWRMNHANNHIYRITGGAP